MTESDSELGHKTAEIRADADTKPERGDELYPGLFVHDQRVCGSITVGPSRLPLWAVPLTARLEENWDYASTEYGVTDEHVSEFIHDLLDARRDLGRLLLVIADCERREGKNGRPYGGKRAKDRLLNALNDAFQYVEDDYVASTTRASHPVSPGERASSGSVGAEA